jgi:Ser/Thr protein kinase RdoA (MazF antagonist)
MSSYEDVLRTILSRYPAPLRPTSIVPLGNRGGFSGARLWRLSSPAGALCLRAWPVRETQQRLLFRHRLMATARAGLSFVPAVFAARDGSTALSFVGRWWEVTEWLPGRADFRERPSPARLEAASAALARLHTAWEEGAAVAPACPAVQRRLEAVRDWSEVHSSGWRPLSSGPLGPLLSRAGQVLAAQLPQVPERLQRWARAPARVQPCLCDVWHDHLLYEEERLTGLVDYGAVKVDAVAVDLARMLGSLVGDDEQGWQIGLRAYRSVRPLSAGEEDLARVLDVTGVVLSVVNWLRWLVLEGRTFDDGGAVARRLEELLARIEKWL